MAGLNTNFMKHPGAQTWPESQEQWQEFIKVLAQYTQDPDEIDVAIQGWEGNFLAVPQIHFGKDIAANSTAITVNTADIAAIVGQTLMDIMADNSGGTDGDSVEAVVSTGGDDITINSNFASVAQDLIEIRAALVAAGIMA